VWRTAPHSIPQNDIELRFPRSLNNLLHAFSHAVDRCICFMNDGESPVMVFEQRGEDRNIIDDFHYNQLLQGTRL